MCEAVDENLLSDATSKNALYKIHVGLGKIVNTLEEEHPAGAERTGSVENSTMVDEEPEPVVKTEEDLEEEEESEGTVVPKLEDDGDEEGLVEAAEDETMQDD